MKWTRKKPPILSSSSQVHVYYSSFVHHTKPFVYKWVSSCNHLRWHFWKPYFSLQPTTKTYNLVENNHNFQQHFVRDWTSLLTELHSLTLTMFFLRINFFWNNIICYIVTTKTYNEICIWNFFYEKPSRSF